jgi:hypothetical protein
MLMGTKRPNRTFQEHLRNVVIDENGCWLWPGVIESNGYGRAYVKRQNWWAHRLSYVIHKSAIPAGLVVCHRCDVRQCVNPDHLFVGTIADNQQDMKAKGRAPRGEKSGSAKLTEESVRHIRNDKRRYHVIAAEFGISQTTISEIKSRKVWAHVQ